ncbi:dual specificity protein phosphatase 12 [Biomphalaria pfeifferi]|uniref:Dual specificity protein phosphatase 12 n=1 Tax=Biomphalaria pfeifferi TaxID=112525 RepID=A0AAD8B0Z7_BIOPF|nr:dual specificity protein phosphatase 12 [Biomphalaria pfeifferi]
METSDCIVEGLYLGGVMAALNEHDLQVKNVTHILSVDEKPLPEILTSKYSYKHVFALDLYDFNLLDLFPECFLFIDQAREGRGTVLVHCQAGISRSSTVVAAYLMQKHLVTKDKALEIIAAVRHFIRPNDGFQEQLQLFENMGCRIDKSHPEYRAYQLNKLAVRFKCGQFSQGEPVIPSEVYVQPDYSAKGNDAYYKCRKCRMFLFHDGALTSHNIGQGESAFDWRSKLPASKLEQNFAANEAICQKSLFVDPLTWMKGKINPVQGKLNCPKCDIKIGSYVWFGEKCPCGAWVAPAFHIDSGKVDKIPSQPVMPRTHTPAAAAEVTTAISPEPVHLIGAVTAFPVSSTGGGRPLGHNPLPERPAAGSRLSLIYPVAAVQPRMATSAGPGDRPLIASVSASQGLSSPEHAPQPIQSMDYETGETAQTSADPSTVVPDNRDLESGINSIHMDVDSN